MMATNINLSKYGSGTSSCSATIGSKIFLSFCPLILIFGTFTNISSLLVLSRKRMRKHSTYVYLAILSCVDLMALWLGLTRDYLAFGFGIYINSTWLCRMHSFLFYYTLDLSSWILVAVSLDRFLAISFLFSSYTRQLLLKMLAKPKLICSIISVSLFLLNLHFLCFIEVDEHANKSHDSFDKLIFNNTIKNNISQLLRENTVYTDCLTNLINNDLQASFQNYSSSIDKIECLNAFLEMEYKPLMLMSYELSNANEQSYMRHSIGVAGEYFYCVIRGTKHPRYLKFFLSTWPYIDLSAYAILPFCIMFICNISIIKNAKFSTPMSIRVTSVKNRRNEADNFAKTTPTTPRSTNILHNLDLADIIRKNRHRSGRKEQISEDELNNNFNLQIARKSFCQSCLSVCQCERAHANRKFLRFNFKLFNRKSKTRNEINETSGKNANHEEDDDKIHKISDEEDENRFSMLDAANNNKKIGNKKKKKKESEKTNLSALRTNANTNMKSKTLVFKQSSFQFNNHHSKNIKMMTLTIISITCIFILLTLPIMLFIIVDKLGSIESKEEKNKFFLIKLAGMVSHMNPNCKSILWAFVNIFMYVNHSVNFVLYCLTGSKFRTELANVLSPPSQSTFINMAATEQTQLQVPLRKYSTGIRNSNGIKTNYSPRGARLATPVETHNMFLNTIVI